MNTSDENVTTIDLLRHGACEGGDIYRGRIDVPLSVEGWRQMEQAVSRSGAWQRIATSPLLRCREFSEQYADKRDMPLEIVGELQELDFGAWEGRLAQEVWQDDPVLVSRFYDDPSAVTPPGGEPIALAQQRVIAGWNEILRVGRDENILIVCHGGVIRLLMGYLLDMPLSAITRLHIPYASMTRVQVYHNERGDFPVVMSLNSAEPLQ